MWFFHMLCYALLRLWFFIFDRLILYPTLRYLSTTFGIHFLNLGYWPTEDSLKEDVRMKLVVEQCSSETDPDRPHYYLYERALMVHPKYPTLQGLQLLEVGCGQGNGLKWIKKAHPKIKSVLGVDRCVSKDIWTMPGDAHELPFEDQKFDMVINVESSHLYYNCEQFFRECARVLRMGGYLCWIDLRYQAQAKRTREQANKAGFIEERWSDVTENVLQGIERTAARYDKMLKKAPLFVRLLSTSFRVTYCAPGTHTHARFVNREKGYYVALWRTNGKVTSQRNSSHGT